jgi:hypothetical protein
MEVIQPVFIVGTGRCGSTVFNDVFTHHPQLCWLSHLAEKHPREPAWNAWAMRAIDLPVFGQLARRHIDPAEAYAFWDAYAPGFSRPCRDLLANDVTPGTRKRLHRAFAQIGSPRRTRLLAKITGWPRLRYLKEVFPDARFIHVYRDGRAVASSWLRLTWFRGWSGPSQWLWGELDEKREAKWRQYDRSFVALAALAWEILMEAFDEARATLPAGDYLELSYEHVCANPRAAFAQAVEFAGLSWHPALDHALMAGRLSSANDKWQIELSPTQRDILESCLGPALARRGYASS